MGAGQGAEAASLTSSGNLFGLKERCVAMESIACVAEELRRLKTPLKGLLPAYEAQRVDHWYTHTVDAVEDLREHVYREVARLLVRLEWLPETIGDSDKMSDKLLKGKYNKKDIGTQNNAWVDKLMTEWNQYAAKLACAEVTTIATRMLWELAAATAAEQIVWGLSRVKKCTMEGRALMSLDMQVLLSGMKKLAPPGTRLDQYMRTCDTYIKAFYTPESELLHWCMVHPEFNRIQIVSLVNQVADANGWKKAQKQDFMAQLEANGF